MESKSVSLPTEVKEFIEDQIAVIETLEWKPVLELARIRFSRKKNSEFDYLMKSLVDNIYDAGFLSIKNAQYDLFDHHVRTNLRDYILDAREGTIDFDHTLSSFINTYCPRYGYGLTEEEMARYLIEKGIAEDCEALIYNDGLYWRIGDDRS